MQIKNRKSAGEVVSGRVELTSLKLSGNAWSCDCQLIWIRDWIKGLKAKSMPSLMSPINNFNSNNSSSVTSASTSGDSMSIQSSPHPGSSSSSSSSFNSMTEIYEKLLSQALDDVRDGKCKRSGKSLLDVFRRELRDCRRNSSPSHPKFSNLSILLGYILFFSLRYFS